MVEKSSIEPEKFRGDCLVIGRPITAAGLRRSRTMEFKISRCLDRAIRNDVNSKEKHIQIAKWSFTQAFSTPNIADRRVK
jgi:hypothetical protein